MALCVKPKVNLNLWGVFGQMQARETSVKEHPLGREGKGRREMRREGET